MKLEELQKHWTEFGRTDPLWAILTVPDKKDGNWTPVEFFETGAVEIAMLMRYVESLGWPLARKRALDFGCGVGRVTQALCGHFDECHGVDIAPTMLRLADQFNRHRTRCSYHLNTADDLRLFPADHFNLVYSNIVLQHMKPEFSANYIREFVRILAPGGLIVFQLPSEPVREFAAPTASSSLPDHAFNASIHVLSSVGHVKTLSQIAVRVAVKNLGGATWPCATVHLGNHWLDDKGNVLILDDARAALPYDLKPGAEVEVSLSMNTPSEAGTYQIELDMVQEGVAWFNQRGSRTEIIRVQVAGAPSLPATTAPGNHRPFIPQMEMYGTPIEVVIGLVRSCGGRTVEVTQDHCAGAAWHSYRYCLTKDRSPAHAVPESLHARVREIVDASLPADAVVLVISKGDDELLRLGDRRASHFPQTEQGVYAGYHPADSMAAITHLEDLRVKGARYLVIPRTALWWLTYYGDFTRHLAGNYRLLVKEENACVIYSLMESAAEEEKP
jgi:SAM-dependent methyltransferase